MERDITRSQTRFRSSLGTFDLHAFCIDGREHAALACGSPELDEQPLVRVQSACLTGSAFLADLCDCRQQLHLSMEIIARAGRGLVVHLDQEGRGHGLVEKVSQLDLIAQGSNTVDAPALRGLKGDLRTYDDAALILRQLVGDVPLRLLTNNPTKIQGLQSAGVVIGARVPIETEPTVGNRGYLQIKKQRMGHLLDRV